MTTDGGGRVEKERENVTIASSFISSMRAYIYNCYDYCVYSLLLYNGRLLFAYYYLSSSSPSSVSIKNSFPNKAVLVDWRK